MSSEDAQTPEKPRLLTGDRPTGPLHLGHLVGTLRERVALQDDHDVFLIVADLHTLTTRPEREYTRRLPEHVRAVVLDLLSVGIDPERSTIYLQSGVPAVYDLAILLQMITPAARLASVDSLGEMARVAGVPEERTSLGLLGYPVLQAADILMARAQVIPVGADNVANVEIARELAERFNREYGEVFPAPRPHVSRTPRLPGIGGSGGKMSKSARNTVDLSEAPDSVSDKLRSLEGEDLFAFVDAFVDEPEEAASLRSSAPEAVRERLVEAVQATLEPIRERRAKVAAEEGLVEEILVDGTIRAREVAYATLQKVREAMGLEGLWQGLVAPTEARAEARKKPY